jgi:RNA polymerase sigma factor (sigma-70 family)
VNSLTDQQLLRDYTGRRSETAFAELVRRHVDFVYSAALRMVRDTHLAEDVTQGVFVALAQNARHLTDRPVLSGWLHRTAQNLAANTVRSDVRRRAREQEAATMNELLVPEPEAIWEHIAPQLDAALGELNEPDRDALLLRYFERKSAREMAQTLGTTEDAAQKRVSRAVERLREFFTKRNVTIGASGLAVLISANAVQAAPAGLVATISATAVLAGTAAQTSTIIAATKAIAMTTLQKTVITATVAVLAGAGIYVARQTSQLREQNQALQQQQSPLAEQIRQLNQAFTKATNQIAALREENERLNRNTAELFKLRGEVARLRRDSEELAALKAGNASDPSVTAVNAWLDRVERLKQRLQQTPGASIPELQAVTQDDWLIAAQADLKTDADFRRALSRLRFSAENKYVRRMVTAVKKYAEENAGQLPADLLQVRSNFDPPVEDAILQRYEIVPAASLPTLTLQELDGWVITQKAPVDMEYDSRLAAGPAMWGSGSFEQSEMVKTLTPALRAYAEANNGNLPTEPNQLATYVTTPEEQAALQKGIKMFEAESPEHRALDLKLMQRIRLK